MGGSESQSPAQTDITEISFPENYSQNSFERASIFLMEERLVRYPEVFDIRQQSLNDLEKGWEKYDLIFLDDYFDRLIMFGSEEDAEKAMGMIDKHLSDRGVFVIIASLLGGNFYSFIFPLDYCEKYISLSPNGVGKENCRCVAFYRRNINC